MKITNKERFFWFCAKAMFTIVAAWLTTAYLGWQGGVGVFIGVALPRLP